MLLPIKIENQLKDDIERHCTPLYDDYSTGDYFGVYTTKDYDYHITVRYWISTIYLEHNEIQFDVKIKFINVERYNDSDHEIIKCPNDIKEYMI